MIAINKVEKDIISARFPNIHIVRTMKQKSKRHHYYCEESRSVKSLLREIREVGENISQKAVGVNGYRKKTN